MDNKKVTTLILLDLLKSFDIIELSQITYEIVINRRVTFQLVRPLPVPSHKFHPFRPPPPAPYQSSMGCHKAPFFRLYFSAYIWMTFPSLLKLRTSMTRKLIVFPIRFRHNSHETEGRLESISLSWCCENQLINPAKIKFFLLSGSRHF